MLDDKMVDELKLKHGPLMAVECADKSLLVFRRPKRVEYDTWIDKREESRSASARQLAQSTLVYPDRDTMISALDVEPALLFRPGGIIDAILDLSGTEQESKAKKL